MKMNIGSDAIIQLYPALNTFFGSRTTKTPYIYLTYQILLKPT